MKSVDAKSFQKAFLAGAKAIEARKEYINELNVFPVPDGDTGTNMTMTILAAAREVAAIENPTFENLAKAISSGSLRGARGNSGVILSQIFRGFTKRIAVVDEIDASVLLEATMKAASTAYKAVMKPKEGTILTVIRAAAEKAEELQDEEEDIVTICETLIDVMQDALNHTPDLLPVLKQAGVVDSGGEGLLTVVKGSFDSLMGKEVDLTISGVARGPVISGTSSDAGADIKFGYCTEFIVMLEKEYTARTEKEFKSYLEGLGDCVVVVSDEDIVKVHVHTNDPGLAIQKGLSYGSLTSMKIDNMREEHQEKVIKDAEKQAKAVQQTEEMPHKDVGFLSVSVGDGLSDIFKDLGVDVLIEGGQTMNPSTEDVLEAVEKVNADVIYILPNNSNIILAAEQAAKLTEDKQVVVIPSKSIPQGIAAMIGYVAGQSVEQNTESMIEEMSAVKSGQVTYAVRDTNMDGKDIKQGDYMGLDEKTIVSVGEDLEEVTLEMLGTMVDEESEFISIYYGEDVTAEQAEAFTARVEETFEDAEVEMNYGGQPVYAYFVSVE